MKQIRKTNLLKKLNDIVWQSNYNVFIYFQMFYSFLYTYFGPGQECTKFDQIVNKNVGDFITLCLFYHYIALKCL